MWTVAGGLALGIFYTASPLTVCSLAAFAGVLWLATRGLRASEARALAAVLVAALLVRLAVIAVLFVAGMPHHNDLAVGALSGDEAYNLARALRTRDILTGVAATKYDYFVAYDEYGRSSYLSFLTALQYLFGPTPYGVRVLNAVFFLAGAAILFRLARVAFGFVPAIAAMAVLVFLPSLIYASTTVLKESVYFFAGAVLIAAVMQLLRPERPHNLVSALVLALGCLWILSDLRRGAEVLAPAGIALGIALRFAAATPRRAAIAAIAAAVALIIAINLPAVRSQLATRLSPIAKIHTGHVFTIGHDYKLLDDGFYRNVQTPAASTITLTPDQAVRFVVRGLVTFMTIPLPWQIASRSELALMPEQLIWYALLLSLPVGIAAGWRRDALFTAILLGFVFPTAIVLALTNGNVGTIVRLRGLVTPYLIWIGALGVCVMLEALARRAQEPRSHLRYAVD
jgi:hypothetical protein